MRWHQPERPSLVPGILDVSERDAEAGTIIGGC